MVYLRNRSRRKIFKSKQKVVSLSISLEDLEELHVDMEPEPTMTPEVRKRATTTEPI